MVKQFKFCHHIPFYVHICIYLKINRHCSLFTLNDSHYNGWCGSHSLFFVPLRLLHATHCPPLHPLPLHSPPVSPSRNLSQKNLHTYPGTIKLWLVRVRHPPHTHIHTHTPVCLPDGRMVEGKVFVWRKDRASQLLSPEWVLVWKTRAVETSAHTCFCQSSP